MPKHRLSPASNEVSLPVADFHGAALVLHIAQPEKVAADDWSDPHITAVFAADSDIDIKDCINLADLWDYVDEDELTEAFDELG